MLKVTENFAGKHNIVFSTHENPDKSKSKCIWFNGKSGDCRYPEKLHFDGKELPWVKSALHLGHKLTQECNMKQGAWVSRAKFIDKSVDIKEMFHFANPNQIVTAMDTYCNDWYGSCLWDLFGVRAKQCYTAWNVALRLAWDLPRTTHRWVVEHLLQGDVRSARDRVMQNYVGFLGRLGKSTSWEVRIVSEIVSRDAASTTGRNISKMSKEFGQDPRQWSAKAYGQFLTKSCVPPEEYWMADLLQNMMDEKFLEKQDSEAEEELETLNFFIDTLATI